MHLLHRHYLVQRTDKIFYFFYLNKNQEIQYNIYSDNNILLKKVKLIEEIITDFAVTIDTYNQIHLIYMNKSGVLNYCIGLDGNWKHKIITHLDVKFNNYRYFSLLVDTNYTHIFYTKSSLLNKTIASIEHMYWNEDNLNKTIITTYITGKYPSPYQMDIDSIGNIHLIYKVFYKSNHQLFYNKFNIFNNKWGDGEIISDLQDENSHPNILIDRKDNLHLVWCIITNNNFILNYKKKTDVVNVKSTWSNLRALSSVNSNNISPILLNEGSTIKILSKQNDGINEILSDDYGLSWKGDSNPNYKGSNIIAIKYASNNNAENKSSKFKCLYGEIKNNINIFSINLFKKNSPENIIDIANNVSNTHHFIAKTDENDKKNLDKLIYNIENHIKVLSGELDKLFEIKKMLEKKTSNPEISKNCPIIPESKATLIDHLLEVNSTLTALREEKNIFEKEMDHLQKQFYILENGINKCQNHYLLLEKELTNLDDDNTGFFNKIINLFK